jgi:hypothetical protein
MHSVVKKKINKIRKKEYSDTINKMVLRCPVILNLLIPSWMTGSPGYGLEHQVQVGNARKSSVFRLLPALARACSSVRDCLALVM